MSSLTERHNKKSIDGFDNKKWLELLCIPIFVVLFFLLPRYFPKDIYPEIWKGGREILLGLFFVLSSNILSLLLNVEYFVTIPIIIKSYHLKIFGFMLIIYGNYKFFT